MLASLHNMSHRPPAARGTPAATRTRTRWQPYNQLASAASSNPAKTPLVPYLTPPSSVSSINSSFSQSTPCDLDSTLQSTIQPCQTRDAGMRDSAKNKYALGLVDMAVHSLCDIWRPHYIPPAFRSANLASTYTSLIHQSTIRRAQRIASSKNHQTHLPSPISPNDSPLLANTPLPALITEPLDPMTHAAHIKGFVTEVLRRSKTSGCILQTALCYLGAIRDHIPELSKLEEQDIWDSGPENSSVSVPQADQQHEAEVAMNVDPDSQAATPDSVSDTIKVCDTGLDAETESECVGTADLFSPLELHMPSPLLCPRRAFLAALILASKFLQDKCYSNRAWAKLSGLPPREVGRCERALGAALDWRLWVGRSSILGPFNPDPMVVVGADAPICTNRSLSRTQSESSILSTPSPCRSADVRDVGPAPRLSRSLSRSASLPTAVFYKDTTKCPPITPPPSQDDAIWESGYAIANPAHPSHDLSSIASIPPYPGEVDINVPPPEYPCPVPLPMLDRTPSPETPGLTYSPSSTESSSGDRTVQMCTLSDDAMAYDSVNNRLPFSVESWLSYNSVENSKSSNAPDRCLNVLEDSDPLPSAVLAVNKPPDDGWKPKSLATTIPWSLDPPYISPGG